MVNHSKLVIGGTVKLADLLDEAIERATVLINEKNPIYLMMKNSGY